MCVGKSEFVYVCEEERAREQVGVCMCARVCGCGCVCARVCACACVCVCVHACMRACVFWYLENIRVSGCKFLWQTMLQVCVCKVRQYHIRIKRIYKYTCLHVCTNKYIMCICIHDIFRYTYKPVYHTYTLINICTHTYLYHTASVSRIYTNKYKTYDHTHNVNSHARIPAFCTRPPLQSCRYKLRQRIYKCRSCIQIHIENVYTLYMLIHTHTYRKDALDALSFKVLSRNRALQVKPLLRKETWNLRYPMHLDHPVPAFCELHSLSLSYGVATISKLLKITGLFCKRAL